MTEYDNPPMGQCDTCGNKYQGWALGVDNKNHCDCGGSIVLIPAHDRLIDEHPPPVIHWDFEHRQPMFKDMTRRTYQVEIPDADWVDFLRRAYRRKYFWGQGDGEYVTLTAQVIETDDMDTITEIEMEWE
jgi:hypothetical protein